MRNVRKKFFRYSTTPFMRQKWDDSSCVKMDRNIRVMSRDVFNSQSPVLRSTTNSP